MFEGAQVFNQPLNDWKVNKYVTNIRDMFIGAKVFNQPLNNWEVNNVMEI